MSWRRHGRHAVPVCSSFGGTVCRNPVAAGQPQPVSWSEWTGALHCLHPHCPRWWGSTDQHLPTTAPPVRPLRHKTRKHTGTRETWHRLNRQCLIIFGYNVIQLCVNNNPSSSYLFMQKGSHVSFFTHIEMAAIKPAIYYMFSTNQSLV